VSQILPVVVVGDVDHGKSTMLGRLLYDTGQLADGKAEAVIAAATRRGMPVEWSFVLDALQVERDQAITLDATRIRFQAGARTIEWIDAPGHPEFLGRLITAAAAADAALILVDVTLGVGAHTRHQVAALALLGITQVIVAINKLDLATDGEAAFRAVAQALSDVLAGHGVTATAILPTIARSGQMLATRGADLAWYRGPTLVDALAQLVPAPGSAGLALRLPIQDVYHFDHRRILAGQVAAGQVAVGDRLLFSPGTATARVASIEAWPDGTAPDRAQAGAAIGITLDSPVFVARGALASHDHSPPVVTTLFTTDLIWLGAEPLVAGRALKARIGWRDVDVVVQAVTRSRAPDQIARFEIGAARLRAREPVALDPASAIAATGRCVLTDQGRVVGGGIVSASGLDDQRRLYPVSEAELYAMTSAVTPAARAARNGHRGGVIWLTGLSGSGKSTLAMAAEAVLFARGFATTVLDGDAVRGGLNADLGFSPADRAENIRRMGEVAALMADAGLIVFVAAISPYLEDRARARHAAARSQFFEVYVATPLEACEARDPKGLYVRARSGVIPGFTGVSAPYEAPSQPDLTINTEDRSVEACCRELVECVVGWVQPSDA
jgi:bifunctional enzyme CysN/CysC